MREAFQQHDVYELAAVLDIKGRRSATNDLDVSDLVSADAVQLCPRFIGFPRQALAIDEDIRAASEAAVAIGVWPAAVQDQVDTRNPIEHVIDGEGGEFRKVLGRVVDGRIGFRAVLGRAGQGYQQRQ